MITTLKSLVIILVQASLFSLGRLILQKCIVSMLRNNIRSGRDGAHTRGPITVLPGTAHRRYVGPAFTVAAV